MARESLIIGRDLPNPSFVEGHAPAAVEVARRAEAAAAHLARVASSADVAQVYGALVDLFISTPPELVETRAAALDRYARALSRAEHDALAAAVTAGLLPTSVIPPCPSSMYTAGVSEGVPLVLRPEPEPVPEPEPEPIAELEPEAGDPAPQDLQLVPDRTTALAHPAPAELELMPPAAIELVPEPEPEAEPVAAPAATPAPTSTPRLEPLPVHAAERPRVSMGSVLAGLGAVAVVLRALRRRRHRG